MAQSYKDLEIYKKSLELSVQIHNLTLKLPAFELYEQGSQIRKSSKSITANIVEGFGRRRYKQEFIKFLTYALASCDETAAHLEILYRTKSLNSQMTYKRFYDEYDHLGKMITNFIKTVSVNHKTRI